MQLNWGIIGLGHIAEKFAKDLKMVSDNNLVGAASRSLDKANKFVARFDAPLAFNDYSSILSNDKIDIVYIATPHHLHHQIALEALNKGKHVLCEKPITVNAGQLNELIAASKDNNKFLMEALWSRFNPSVREVIDLIKSGTIGKVRYLNADFYFNADISSDSRLTNPNLAGGALLDIGIYPVFLSYVLLGKPNTISIDTHFTDRHVDLQSAMIFKYDNAMSILSCGFNVLSDMVAKISGTKGEIQIDARWHEADGYTLIKDGKKSHKALPRIGTGFTHEIEACYNSIVNGETNNQLWSHQNSMDLMSLLDKLRAKIGLSYPFEK